MDLGTMQLYGDGRGLIQVRFAQVGTMNNLRLRIRLPFRNCRQKFGWKSKEFAERHQPIRKRLRGIDVAIS